jgi:hypothetical protein
VSRRLRKGTVGTEQASGKDKGREIEKLRNAIPFRAGHFFTGLHLINFVTRRKG